MSVYTDYFEQYKKYNALYGKIALMYEVGKFYEIYEIDTPTEKLGNTRQVAADLNILIMRGKDNAKGPNGSKTNPIGAGFQVDSAPRFINILLEENYTVVVFNQISGEPSDAKKTRKLHAVYTPTTYMDPTIVKNNMGIISIYIQINKLPNGLFYNAGVTFLDTVTTSMNVAEIHTGEMDHFLEELYRFIHAHNPREVIFSITGGFLSEDELVKYFEMDRNKYYFNFNNIKKEMSIPSYQNAVLKKAYPVIDSDISPIEYLGLEKHPDIIVGLIILIQFIYDRNETLLQGLPKPSISIFGTNLTLSNDTIYQLNIIKKASGGGTCILDIIDNTVTPMGKRYLRSNIVNPTADTVELNRRYNIIEQIMHAGGTQTVGTEGIDKYLKNICDLTRLRRKISLCSIHPYEIASLYKSLELFIALYEFDTFLEKNDELISVILALRDEIKQCFNLSFISEIKLQDIVYEIFQKGYDPVLDKLGLDIGDGMKKLKEFALYLESKIKIKPKTKNPIMDIENKNGIFSLKCTEMRWNSIKPNLSEEELEEMNVSILRKKVKITGSKIDAIVESMNKDKSCSVFYSKYLQIIQKWSRYDIAFDWMIQYISRIDFYNNGAKIAAKYKYTKPLIVEPCFSSNQEPGPNQNPNQGSFFKADGLRHPIIEIINTKTEYVKNDISIGFGTEQGVNGILLYAVNSAGKTSLLRAAGLNIIMAQIGYYCSADRFEYNPYRLIISRVNTEDSIDRGLGFFAVELNELQGVLKYSNKNCLVLSDELTKGTETYSGASIMATTLEFLCNNKYSFIFTSHLHQVSQLECIRNLNGLRICHLTVKYENGKLNYNRKLAEGPGETYYGIEFAKMMNLDATFISRCYELRKELIGLNKEYVSTKSSKYNRNVYIDHCDMCGKTLAQAGKLEVHHIQQQALADKNGFIGTVHKDNEYNLQVLCTVCHDSIPVIKPKKQLKKV
jgi:DNA mismatch repair protein MutS